MICTKKIFIWSILIVFINGISYGGKITEESKTVSKFTDNSGEVDPFRLGIQYYENKDYLSALDQFIGALVTQPEREEEIKRYIELIGIKLGKTKDSSLQTPDKSFEPKTTSLDVKNCKLDFAFAKDYYQRKQYIRALDEFYNLLNRCKDDEKIQTQSQKYISKIKNIAEKISLKKGWFQSEGDQLYANGLLAFAEGDSKKCLSYWEEYIRFEPANEEVNEYYMQTKLQLDRLDMKK